MSKNISRILIPVIIVWISAIALFSVIFIWINSETPEYTQDNHAVFIDETAYITDNYGNNGVIWKSDLKGKQLGIYDTSRDKMLKGWNISGIDSVEENLYVVFERKTNDGGRMINQYCVAILNDSFGMNFITPVFRFPMELNLSGFSAREDTLFLTALSDNGQQAYVYSVKTASMIEVTGEYSEDSEKWKKAKTTPVTFDTRESVWPRFFTDAEYSDDNFNLRYDNSEPGYFANNDAAKTVYSKVTTGLKALIRTSSFNPVIPLLCAFIGTMLIIAIGLALRTRRRVAYAIAGYETLLLVLTCGLVFFIALYNRNVAEKEYVRFAVADAGSIFDGYAFLNLNSENLYNSDEYGILSDRVTRRVGTTGAGVEVSDVLVVDALSGNVVISASGNNSGLIEEVYGSEVSDMLKNIGNGDGYVFKKIRLKGRDKAVLASSLNPSGQQAFALITIIDAQSIYTGFFADAGNCIKLIAVIYVLGSLLGLILIVLQSGDIRKLQNALVLLAKGEEAEEKGAIIGRDMNHMWNSITEIRKNIINTNRIKFLTYEAYFRFAPKSIEKILKKQSITEIKSGDVISANGGVALLTIPDKKRTGHEEISRKSELLGITENCRENYDGVLISHDSELSSMKYLFNGENGNSVSFGVDLMQKLREDKGRGFNRATMILHYAPYIYGVAGDDKQAAVYFSSEESEKLWSYAEWFISLRFALIITGEMLEKEGAGGDFRYIGFIIPDKAHPERRIKLYEALDAELPAVRSRRLRQKARFAEALDLFYKKDFYIARGVFSEILRESPDDELSKWYLFECEKYLDGEMELDFVGELHMD